MSYMEDDLLEYFGVSETPVWTSHGRCRQCTDIINQEEALGMIRVYISHIIASLILPVSCNLQIGAFEVCNKCTTEALQTTKGIVCVFLVVIQYIFFLSTTQAIIDWRIYNKYILFGGIFDMLTVRLHTRLYFGG